MMPRVPYVSVVEPIGPAIERVKLVLFRPFDLGRWFVIGFCAWLAHLGQGGSGGGGGRAQNYIGNAEEFRGLIPVAIITLIVIVGLWLLVMWLSSRGRFMFLYCIAQNRAEVKNPWHWLGEHGDRLFAFRVVFAIIAILMTLLIGAIIVIPIFVVRGNLALSIAGGVTGGLLLLVSTIVFGLVGKFTKDFAVPIMYLRTPSIIQAWRLLLDLLAANKARFFLYVLFHVVINIAIGSIVVAIACLTCGCACCLLALPFVGTVIMLPVLVFLRSYSLFYLAQYGPEFNVFAPAPQGISPPTPPSA